MCRQPLYRPAVAAVLPHLKQLDGRPISPGEALQYLAALQLQAFQPQQPQLAVSVVQQQRQQQPHQAQGTQGAQAPTAAACDAPRAGMAAGRCASSEPLRRIQQVLASLAGAAGPSNVQQQHDDAEQDGSSPEYELQELLQSCPQLAGTITSVLAKLQAPADPPQLQRSTARRTCAAAQTEPEAASHGNTVAAEEQEQLHQQVAALQDEAAAWQAELEVQTAAAQRARQEADAVAQRSQQQAADAARAAEAQAAEARQQAAGVLDQARRELSSLQVGSLPTALYCCGSYCCACLPCLPSAGCSVARAPTGILPASCLQGQCSSLSTQLAGARSDAAAGQRRQADLEYELGRAWQELEAAEAARQEQQQRAAAEAERSAAELAVARGELAALRGELAAARQDVVQQRQAGERIQADGAAAAAAGSQRQEQLQHELVATHAQLAEQQQQLKVAREAEREAAQQVRQLSTTLAAVHEEHGAALAALRQRQVEELAAVAAGHSAALAGVERERDEAQQRLAATEAEFRCALQVGPARGLPAGRLPKARGGHTL
mgnify:CR=1 FL=1